MKNDYEIMSRFVLNIRYNFKKLKNQSEVKKFIDEKINDYNIESFNENEIINIKKDLEIYICQMLF